MFLFNDPCYVFFVCERWHKTEKPSGDKLESEAEPDYFAGPELGRL